MPRARSIVRAALPLLLAAPGPPAASLSAGPGLGATVVPPVILPLWCGGAASLGCVLDAPGRAWTPDPADGRRLLEETFLLELRVTGSPEWRPFTFSLPLLPDRSRVRLVPGDPVFLNLPVLLKGEQLFACEPVPTGQRGPALAACVVKNVSAGPRGLAGSLRAL